jgi:FkbM family methyltransferase
MMKQTFFWQLNPIQNLIKLLSENWGWNANIRVVSEICSDHSDEDTFAIQEKNGTASIIESENGIKMRRRRLDEILSDHPFAQDVNVLKIDTDGHDFEVINGSIGLISRYLSIILFECDAFDDTNYVEHCLKTLLILKECGYNYFLLYDNFGYLIGQYALSDLSPFRQLLFYQLTSSFYYFDILLMKDDDLVEFYKNEVNYFTEKMGNKLLQRTAIAAAELY